VRKAVFTMALAAVLILGLSTAAGADQYAQEQITVNASVGPYVLFSLPGSIDLPFELASLDIEAPERHFFATADVPALVETNTAFTVLVTRSGNLPDGTSYWVNYAGHDYELLGRPYDFSMMTWSGNVTLGAKFTVEDLTKIPAGNYTDTLTITVSVP